MQKQSIKEYENLSHQEDLIKASINRFVGYIIGVFGVLTALGKYLIMDPSEKLDYHFKPFALFVLLGTILVVTLLFEIIWYKFKSHNRFVGYIELLSQEMDFIYPKEKLDKKSKYPFELYNDIESKYGNTEKDSEEISDEREEHFITWSFMMSRYNNSIRWRDQEGVKTSTKNMLYSFVYPPHYQEEEVSKPISHSNFFTEIIYDQFYTKKSDIKAVCKEVLYSFCSIVFLVLNFIRSVRYNKDKRYIFEGWKYPKKLLQICFTVVLALCFLCFSILFCKYELEFDPSERHIFSAVCGVILVFTVTCFLMSKYDPLKKSAYLFWTTVIAVICILLIDYKIMDPTNPIVKCHLVFLIICYWYIFYCSNLVELSIGRLSIEYYHWSFFIYRVQYLNAKGIIPRYYSRSFWRYYKN